MTKPHPDFSIPEDDGTGLTPVQRLRLAADMLEAAGNTAPYHEPVLKLLTLAVLRLARLEAVPEPTWSHEASAYLTLNTLAACLQGTDFFSRIEPLPPPPDAPGTCGNC